MILSISYDISNNSLRKKISDHLIRSGLIRLQKSVFCGYIEKYRKEKIVMLLKDLHNTSKDIDDRIMIHTITKSSIKRSNFIGTIDDDTLKELRGELRVKIY